MNQIRKEIRDCMDEFSIVDDAEVQASFHIPESFSGFKGHFPGNPTFPGMCVIQAALCILGVWKQRPVRLEEIVLAKYYRIVNPGQKIEFVCREDVDYDNGSEVKLQLTSSGKRLAELRLRVRYG